MNDFVRLDNVEPEKVEWLWEERIPRAMITVVGGRPDQGKGLWAVHLGTYVANNGGRVLHSAIEDGYGIFTRPRYEAAGIENMERVWLDRFWIPAMFEELRAKVIENKIDLVIMDPFAAHLRGVSRHSDNIREVLTPLSKMCEQTGCAVVIIEHALKRVPAGSHPLNAIGGNGSGLPAAARMAYVFGVDPEDEDRRILASVKSNLRATPKALAFGVDVVDVPSVGDMALLIRDQEIDFDPMRMFDNKNKGKIGRPPDKRAAAAEWLTNFLVSVGHPVKAGKVFEEAKQVGMTAKTVRRAAEDMRIVKLPPGGGPSCTWELPDDIKALLGDDEPEEAPAVDMSEPEGETITDQDLAALLGEPTDGDDDGND